MSETKSTGSIADAVKTAIEDMKLGLTALRKLDGSNGSLEQRQGVDEIFNQVLVVLNGIDLPQTESKLQGGATNQLAGALNETMPDVNAGEATASTEELKSDVAKDDIQQERPTETASGEQEILSGPGNAN
jgi:hypothetical protein